MDLDGGGQPHSPAKAFFPCKGFFLAGFLLAAVLGKDSEIRTARDAGCGNNCRLEKQILLSLLLPGKSNV